MADVAVAKKPRRSVRQRREAWAFYLLLSPFLFGFFTLTLGPMIASFYLAFTRWDFLNPPQWIGLDNFNNLFTNDPDYIQGIKVTLTYAAMELPLSLIVSLALAMLLATDIRGVSIFRAIYYMPSLLAGLTVAAIWIFVFDYDHGTLNNLLHIVGLPKVGWLTDPNWVIPSFVLMGVWGVGNTMLIFLAGLKGIPHTLYEAAAIDGAGYWGKLRNVTIPMLTPTIFFNMLTGLIGVFQYFDQSYVMTNGGPPILQGDSIVGASDFYMLKLYSDAFRSSNFGYAAAEACVLFVFIMVLTVIVVKTSSSWVYYEGSVVTGK